jgi:tRNA(Ile)-lysidine synthase
MAACTQNLAEKVGKTIEKHHMPDTSRRVLAAVSGGADSVCLLSVLRELGYELEVGHLDHQTRQGESRQDARFVGELAASLNVPFHLETHPVAENARVHGRSFEEYAREVRYEFLTRAARENGCAAVATGHTADDQAETVLLRLLRGTSLRGAGGIPPVSRRAMDVGDSMPVFRPLLECTRAEIIEYIEKNGLSYRSDISNWDRRYLRNRIRHELLPLLERDYNLEVRQALVRFAELARVDNAMLDEMADAAYAQCVREDAGAVDRGQFRCLNPPLRRRVIAALARYLGVEEYTMERLESAAEFVVTGATGLRFDLGSGVQLQNGHDETYVLDLPREVWEEEVVLRVPGVTVGFGRTFTTKLLDSVPDSDLSRYCTPSRQVFDREAVGCDLRVRRRLQGDRFKPMGAPGSKSLGDYFTDAKIPVPLRDAQLLLTGAGGIAWVIGRAVGDYAALKGDTKFLVEVEVEDGNANDAAF